MGKCIPIEHFVDVLLFSSSANTQHCQSFHADESSKGICSLSLIAISNKMKRTAVNNSSSFHLLRYACGVLAICL